MKNMLILRQYTNNFKWFLNLFVYLQFLRNLLSTPTCKLVNIDYDQTV